MELVNSKFVQIAFISLFTTSFIYSAENFAAEYCIYADTPNHYYLQQVSKKDANIFVKINNDANLECQREESIETESNFYSDEKLIARSSSYLSRGREGCGGEIHSGISCIDGNVSATSAYNLDSSMKANALIINSDFKDSYQGKNITVKWQAKVLCNPHYDTTLSGSYFIRITGECDSAKTRLFEK